MSFFPLMFSSQMPANATADRVFSFCHCSSGADYAFSLCFQQRGCCVASYRFGFWVFFLSRVTIPKIKWGNKKFFETFVTLFIDL